MFQCLPVGVKPLKRAGNFKSQHHSHVNEPTSGSRPISQHSKLSSEDLSWVGKSDHTPAPPMMDKPPPGNKRQKVSLAEKIAAKRRAESEAVPMELDLTSHGRMMQSAASSPEFRREMLQDETTQSTYHTQQPVSHGRQQFQSNRALSKAMAYHALTGHGARMPKADMREADAGVKIRNKHSNSQAKPISFKMVGRLANLHNPDYEIKVEKYKNPLTFKLVAKAVKNYLAQERIMVWGMAPGRFQKKFHFDWARFRNWIKMTHAFDEKLNAPKVYELKAPSPSSQLPGDSRDDHHNAANSSGANETVSEYDAAANGS